MSVNLTKPIGGAVNITYGKYNGYVYFFHTDGTYSRFNRKTCELEFYNDISKGWNNWPDDWPYPHTGITWDNGYVYFFRESEFIRYDITKDVVEGSKASIVANWPGWPGDWMDRVDAALYWGYNIFEKKSKAYFFRDNQYIRYDLKENRVDDGYPLQINNDTWPGWPSHWNQVWAAVDWGNGKIYFFSKEEYLRYDKFYNRVDDGYPRPLGEFIAEQKNKIASENASLLFENVIPSGERIAFTMAVRSASELLDIRPNWLMASMWKESNLRPSSINNNQCVGLHQIRLEYVYDMWGKTALPTKYPNLFRGQAFRDLTADERQVLTTEYVNLGFNQLDTVKRFFAGNLHRNASIKCRSFDQLRLLGFGGVGFAEIDNYLLAPVVASGNPTYDLNKDGKIDVAEFREAVFSMIHDRFKNNPAEDSEIRHSLG